MDRDPAVLAVHALHLTAAELDAVLAGRPIVRPFWPPMQCRGAVVGLHAEGVVVGEALLASFESDPAGGCRWSFGPATLYRQTLPLHRSRRMAGLMPAAPVGTLTRPRDWDVFVDAY